MWLPATIPLSVEPDFVAGPGRATRTLEGVLEDYSISARWVDPPGRAGDVERVTRNNRTWNTKQNALIPISRTVDCVVCDLNVTYVGHVASRSVHIGDDRTPPCIAGSVPYGVNVIAGEGDIQAT